MSASSSSSSAKTAEIQDSRNKCAEGLCGSDENCQHKGLSSNTQYRRGNCAVKEGLSARKIHKADREKLRRDRLNEQLLELAGALEPNRPKNDKYTILADAIQTLKELMTEVERLRAEHVLLADESNDLTQEKNELEEEKTQLDAGVQQLHSQLQQQMQILSMWMCMDPSAVARANHSVYPAIQPPNESSSGYDYQHQAAIAQGEIRFPVLPPHPGPFIPMQILQGSMAVPPGLQARQEYGGACTQFFPCTYNFTGQVEASPAHIPSGMPPVSGYPFHIFPTPPTSHNATSQQVYNPTVSFAQQSARENNPRSEPVPKLSEEEKEYSQSGTSRPQIQDDAAESSQNVPTVLQLRTPNVIYQCSQPK